MKNKTITDRYNSPIGTLFITTCANSVYSISTQRPKNYSKGSNDLSRKVVVALKAYFESNENPLHYLKDITFELDTGTEFQKKVWNELRRIKWGSSLTYGELAERIKSPKAFRAVGSAVGKNPFMIIFPCHRVLAANKKIGGFSAGTDKKIFLLKHEKLEFKACQ